MFSSISRKHFYTDNMHCINQHSISLRLSREDQGNLVAREKSEKLGLKDRPGRPVHPDDLAHRVYRAKPAQLEPRERWGDRETG